MSFEVYVQCFQNGEPAGLLRAAVRGLFPVFETESEVDYWMVRYDDRNTCHVSVQPVPTDLSLLTSLCVFRPCGDLRLWEALLAMLRLGHVVMYFPGCRSPLVADDATIEHLPKEMIESLGVPEVVQTGSDITEAISRS